MVTKYPILKATATINYMYLDLVNYLIYVVYTHEMDTALNMIFSVTMVTFWMNLLMN